MQRVVRYIGKGSRSADDLEKLLMEQDQVIADQSDTFLVEVECVSVLEALPLENWEVNEL